MTNYTAKTNPLQPTVGSGAADCSTHGPLCPHPARCAPSADIQLSEAAKTALINVGTSRQGAVLAFGVTPDVHLELRDAGLIGSRHGLTRKGGIMRDVLIEDALQF